MSEQTLPSSEPPLRKGQLTAQRALDAAEYLFANKGYERTTLREIAENIGIKEPSLYKHFPGKEAIYAAVLERGVKPLLDEITYWQKEPTLTELMNIPQSMFNLLAKHPNVAKLLHREMISSEISPAGQLWFQRLFSSSQQISPLLSEEHNSKQEKLSLLQSIALTNVALGFFASTPLYQKLGFIEDPIEEETLEMQAKVMSQIYKTFIIR